MLVDLRQRLTDGHCKTQLSNTPPNPRVLAYTELNVTGTATQTAKKSCGNIHALSQNGCGQHSLARNGLNHFNALLDDDEDEETFVAKLVHRREGHS